MRIWATSDLHGYLPPPPEADKGIDLAIIAGDIFPLEVERIPGLALQWVEEFFKPWLSSFPCEVIFTWGNHDFLPWQLQHFAEGPQRLPIPGQYIDELYIKDGVRIYLTPWNSCGSAWAWACLNNQTAERLLTAPDDLDIIVSHGPPRGPAGEMVTGENLGQRALDEYAVRSGVEMTISGHVHHAYGKYVPTVKRPYWKYAVSHTNERYEPVNPPLIIDYWGKERKSENAHPPQEVPPAQET